MTDPFSGLNAYYGDLHNHCGISYGHGSLEDALANAAQQLDFVSVTGHAHWPDMPPADDRIGHIIEFHEEGFARLRSIWPSVIETLREWNREGTFVVFPGFEIHSRASGDRNVIYKDLGGDLLYPDSIEELHNMLRRLRGQGRDSIAQPHHVGYRVGTRGIDWSSHDPEFAPFVEMVSMHGCSEASETPRPFLHSMGPSDWGSSIERGLRRGHLFGFSGGTDHHSGHPGSYGHGRTAVWARECTREALWEALYARRMVALTGDRIQLRFSVNGMPLGSVVDRKAVNAYELEITGGAAIDCVDLIGDGRLLRRFSQTDVSSRPLDDPIHTRLHLELGWGPRSTATGWNVEFGIEGGRILGVEPRFRGLEVVSPAERDSVEGESMFRSRVVEWADRSVVFETESQGNPTNSTSATQGVCLEVEMPRHSKVFAVMNGVRAEHPLSELIEGARSGSIDHTDAPSWRFNRAPLPDEWNWSFSLTDEDWPEVKSVYARVRQRNDQWAWSSPVFFR